MSNFNYFVRYNDINVTMSFEKFCKTLTTFYAIFSCVSSVGNTPPQQSIILDVKNQKTLNKKLSQFKWKKRIVLVIYSLDKKYLFEKQKNIFNNDVLKFRERDLVLIGMLKSKSLSVSLIGKDGTIKLKTKNPLSSKELISIIDAMPMRMEEMNYIKKIEE